jgi:uncharacterized protein
MRPTLDPIELRVLGSLVEKAMTTPDSYPLSLNSLTTACNQKTGREPVTEYSDSEVRQALDRVSRRGLAGTTTGAGSRVAKFRHLVDTKLSLSKRELAVLTVLMLRGPQTPGELRTRTERMQSFESVEMVEEALSLLAERDEPLAYELPRRPGQGASRFVHGLSGEPDLETLADEAASSPGTSAGRSALEERVVALEEQVADLQAAFEEFKKQFE